MQTRIPKAIYLRCVRCHHEIGRVEHVKGESHLRTYCGKCGRFKGFISLDRAVARDVFKDDEQPENENAGHF